MASKIKLKRGAKTKLPQLSYGEPAFVSDEKELYIGTETGNIKLTSKSEVEQLTPQLEQNTRIIKNNFSEIKKFAHRGAEGIAPQNTIPSTEYAGMLGYFGVECDLQVTSDGHFVLYHDDTLDSLTNGTGYISTKTLAEIKALNITKGPYITSRWVGTKIPTLQEFLQYCKKWNLYAMLELKYFAEKDLTTLINIIKEENMYNRVYIANTLHTLGLVRKVDKYIDYCVFVGNKEEVDNVANVDNSIIVGFAHTVLTEELVDYAHSKGFRVLVWTNGTGFIEKENDFRRWGVDYTVGGII